MEAGEQEIEDAYPADVAERVVGVDALPDRGSQE